MCGINAGWVHGGTHRQIVENSLNRMAHRGPDDMGVFQDGPVFIGNRRLSIIDLSGGHQPIANEDGTIWVVFNGEIYNYKELIPDLESKGHTLRSQSDTEVLVHLYEEHGVRMCEKLRGMFAFALWDSRSRVLYAARDRFGKKPLYYRVDRNGLVLASELKALRVLSAGLGEQWAIRDRAIYHYLSLSFIPQPETIFENVRTLPPASWLVFDGNDVNITRYWELEYLPKTTKPYRDILPATRRVMAEAVALRLRSDVPLGIFLSGGIDSSIVAYEASKIVGDSLHTFTVEMSGSPLDESPVARRTARFLGIRCTALSLDLDLERDLQSVVSAYDQPMADPSAIPSMRIAELAGGHVKVVLNGDGGDEIFAGYRRYLAARYAYLFSWLPSPVSVCLTDILSAWPAGTGRNPVGFVERGLRGLRLKPAARYLSWTLDMLTAETKEAIWRRPGTGPTEELVARLQRPGLSALDTAMSTDADVILLSALLVKMDVATMSASVEGRSPFMDHVVAEFGAKLPDSYKIRRGRTKAVLRSAYAGLLPDEVIHGTKKGFEPPLGHWLRTDLRSLMMDMLQSPASRVRDYIDGAFVDELLEGPTRKTRNRDILLYSLLILELWLHHNTQQRTRIDGL